LSATGGSVQLVEGSGITLTTTGTAADGIITIASTGGSPSGVAGAVQFSNGSAFASDATNFFWNNTTKGLFLTTPTNGTSTSNDVLSLTAINTSGSSSLTFYKSFGNMSMASTGGFSASANGLINLSTVSYVNPVTIGGSYVQINAGNLGVGVASPTARLQVKGSGATTATFSQINTDSSGNDTLQIRDDGAVKFGGGSFGHPSLTRFQINNGTTGVFRVDGGTVFTPNVISSINNAVLTVEGNSNGVAIQPINANIGWVTIGNAKVNTINLASGTKKHVEVNQGYTAITAAAVSVTVNQIDISPAINMNLQTGTKIFRGIYHNPTLTGTIDHRAFESLSGGGYFNTSSVNASAVLQADSTTQGFLMPRMTTTQRDAIVSPATGLEIYNTTTNSNNFYNGTAWEDTKLVTTNRQAASYTLVLGDANKLVEMNVATANNLTVPLNSTVAYSVGTQILISQYGAGQTTVVATGGVTIRSNGGKLKLSGQYSGATLIKIATDEWYCFGDLSA
jgi:hypothetical protein